MPNLVRGTSCDEQIRVGDHILRQDTPIVEGVVIHVDKNSALRCYVTIAFTDGAVWSVFPEFIKNRLEEVDNTQNVEQINYKNIAIKTDDECPICLETYDRKRRKKIQCPSCQIEACKSCIREYIIQSGTTAQCHKCEAAFTRPFLLDTCGRTFVEREYRKLRKRILLERECSRLPEVMDLLPAYRNKSRLRKSLADLQLLDKSNPYNNNIRTELYSTQTRYVRATRLLNRLMYGTNNNKATVSQFRHPCPAKGCNGLLDQSWHCPSCDMWTCPHCLCVKGHSKDSPHECDPKARASATLIAQETQACPSCSLRIYKISGCDQMWCTQCHTAFSWQTGRRIQGRIHNPHYFEWQRHAAVAMNRDEIVQQRQCEGNAELPRVEIIELSVQSALYNALRKQTYDVRTYPISWSTANTHADRVVNTLNNQYEKIAHLMYHEIPAMRAILDEFGRNENRDIRLRFAANETNRAQFATTILKRDNKRQALQEQLLIISLVGTLVAEAYGHLTTTAQNTIYGLYRTIKYVHQILEYANTELSKVSACYGFRQVYMFVKKDYTGYITPTLVKRRAIKN